MVREASTRYAIVYLKKIGFPYEYKTTMSNLLVADAWINITMQATDDYIKKIANLFIDRAHTSIKIYVEYDNENFNTVKLFPPHRH